MSYGLKDIKFDLLTAALNGSWVVWSLASIEGRVQVCELRHFAPRHLRAFPDMPRSSRKKQKNSNVVTEYQIRRNLVAVSMEAYATCWCQGFDIGCRQVRSRSTRLRHWRKPENILARSMFRSTNVVIVNGDRVEQSQWDPKITDHVQALMTVA